MKSTWQWKEAHWSTLVKGPAKLIFMSILSRQIKSCSTQSRRAKYFMSMCRVCGVGFWALAITVSLAMPSTTSNTSSQTPSVNNWQPNNTIKQHLPWPINRHAMSPPCYPPAASNLPPLTTCCLPLAAQCWCWPAPIAAWRLVSHPLRSVRRSLSKQNKKR